MLQMASRITGLWGGACLAVGCNGEFVAFYDWATGQLVQRVDGDVRGLSWSDDGRFVALHAAQASYLLEFHAERMAAHLGESAAGVEGCLEVLSELDGSEQSGVWYKHAYLFVSQNKLQLVRGEHTEKLAFVPSQRFLLRYIPSLDLVFFADARCALFGYSLDHALLDYECAVVDQDFELANQLLPAVSPAQYDRVARFLDVQGFPESARPVAGHSFEATVSTMAKTRPIPAIMATVNIIKFMGTHPFWKSTVSGTGPQPRR